MMFVPLVALIVSACADRSDTAADHASAPRPGGIAVVCSPTALDNLNPFVTSDLLAADLRLALFTPLVLYDDAGGFRPHLARTWEWSENRSVVTFRLRDDVHWHDGELVTAEDVAWTLERAADPAYAYFGHSNFVDLVAVELPEPGAVRLRFRRPVSADLEGFVGLPILPRHLLAHLGPDEFARSAYHREPIGSGPFRFAGRSTDGGLRFDRNDDFPEGLGRPLLERFVLRAIPEPTTAVMELETGRTDMCIAGPGLAREASRSGRLNLVALEPPVIQGIPLNTRVPPLDDVRVRRAISAALRRDEVASVISPMVRPARNLMPATSPWLTPDANQPDTDSAYAARLLDDAGWSRIGRDGIRSNAAGDRLRISMVAPPQMEVFLVAVQAQLRRVGIQLDLQFMDFAAYIAMIQNPDDRPQAMAHQSIPERLLNPDYTRSLSSEGPGNYSGYADPEVDQIIDQLNAAVDSGARADLYRRLQERVAEDVPVVYLLHVPRVAIVAPRLEGMRADINGPFASATEWWLTTSR